MYRVDIIIIIVPLLILCHGLLCKMKIVREMKIQNKRKAQKNEWMVVDKIMGGVCVLKSTLVRTETHHSSDRNLFSNDRAMTSYGLKYLLFI